MASDRVRRNSKKHIVLFDTNAIFMIFEQNIRINDELTRLLGAYEIHILKQIKDEIIFLQKNGTDRQQRLSKIALSFIKSYPCFQGKEGKTVDDVIFQTAIQESYVVVTNDVDLRKKLCKSHIITLCLRGKNKLMIC